MEGVFLERRGAEMRGDEGEIPRVSVSLNEGPFLFHGAVFSNKSVLAHWLRFTPQASAT